MESCDIWTSFSSRRSENIRTRICKSRRKKQGRGRVQEESSEHLHIASSGVSFLKETSRASIEGSFFLERNSAPAQSEIERQKKYLRVFKTRAGSCH